MSKRIIKFSATWCGPCKLLAKALENVDFGVPLEEVDIDKDEQLAQRYHIRGVPTLILVDEFDDEVNRIVGLTTVDTIKQKFEL